MNLSHIKYQFLNNSREPSFLFWTVVYPLLMALMFHTAFQGFMTPPPMEIRVGVEQGSLASQIFPSIDILKPEVMTKETARSLMADQAITGFVDRDLNITVMESGLNQTVLTSIVSQIGQMQALGVPMQNYDFSASYVRQEQAKANPFLIPFCSLIGLVSLYSVFLGLEFARIIQANQSMEALRLNVVPLKKGDFLFGSLFIGIGLNLASNILLLLFLRFVLNMDFITDAPRTMAVILCANIVGIMLGLLIGGISRLSLGVKNGLTIGLTLVLAALSGMMTPDLKILIDRTAPLLNAYNPVAIVTTQMYRINYLGDTSSFGRSLIILLVLAGAFFLLSQLSLRRKTYDSL